MPTFAERRDILLNKFGAKTSNKPLIASQLVIGPGSFSTSFDGINIFTKLGERDGAHARYSTIITYQVTNLGYSLFVAKSSVPESILADIIDILNDEVIVYLTDSRWQLYTRDLPHLSLINSYGQLLSIGGGRRLWNYATPQRDCGSGVWYNQRPHRQMIPAPIVAIPETPQIIVSPRAMNARDLPIAPTLEGGFTPDNGFTQEELQ